MRRTFQHWIVTKWLEIDQDNLHMKFSASNLNFSSPSPDLLGSRRRVQAGVKDSYPLKVVILPQLSRIAWKRLHIGTDMLFIITSNSDKLFISQCQWPWTPKIGVFSKFFVISGCDTHFKSELRWNGWRWTTCVSHFQRRTYIFKNLTFNLLNSRSLPYQGLKFKYSFKMH